MTTSIDSLMSAKLPDFVFNIVEFQVDASSKNIDAITDTTYRK